MISVNNPRQPHDRAGRYEPQLGGYRAFIPEPLPPSPPLRIAASTLALLSEADRALGRLDGVATTLPNPDLFVGMYVRQEAVLSSQIEGTQASLTDLLELEIWPADDRPRDVDEIVNHIAAMNHGLARLREIPLSLRLISEIHERLLAGTRGAGLEPGRFRTSQNWIGPVGSTISSATFVPPPPAALNAALGDLERYWHDRRDPALIRAGLAHAQFETIHPFRDGNGRMGRLLITFMLCHENVLTRPLLYLSHFLRRNRAAYYDALQAVRDHGDWEGWLEFFLGGVVEVATEATVAARTIAGLRDQDMERVRQDPAGVNLARLVNLLFQQPIVSVPYVRDQLGVQFATANDLVGRLVQSGILEETTGRRRHRRFAYRRYLNLFPAVTGA